MSYMTIQIYPVIENDKVKWYLGTSEHNKTKIANSYATMTKEKLIDHIKDIMKCTMSAEINKNLNEQARDAFYTPCNYSLEAIEELFVQSNESKRG